MEDLLFASQTLVPLRVAAKDQSEMVSQLLFGETARLLEQKSESWIRIKVEQDGYEGWVDPKMMTLLPESLAHVAHAKWFVKVPSLKASIRTKGQSITIHLTLGCALPEGVLQMDQLKINLGATDLSVAVEGLMKVNDSAANEIVELANAYMGAPYLWGGKSIWGVDCSGLTQIVLRMCGIDLLRDASQQAEQGQKIKFGNHKGGDLAFFKNEKGKVVHVGILDTEGNIIHASGRVRKDKLENEGIINWETGIKTHDFYSINRYIL